MVNSSGSKGRPAYWAGSTDIDPPVVFPNIHPLASWQDGRKCLETPTKYTENEARVQKNQVEVAEAGKENGQALYSSEDRTSTTRAIPTTTRAVLTQDTAASSGKRKLDRTSPDSLPSAKRIHSTDEEAADKEFAVDKYKYMNRIYMQQECQSLSLPAEGSIQDLRKRLRLYHAAQEQIPNSQESVKEDPTCHTSSRAGPLDRYKRKLDRTSPDSLPSAKRIHSTDEEAADKEFAIDKYKYMNRIYMQQECQSLSLPAGGSIQDLRKRLRLYHAAQEQIPNSQESVKENPTCHTSSRAGPLDRYTHMSQKDLRKQCVKRLLPVSLAKRDLRRCLRLYDAARDLGLSPEESLEAQRATFQHVIEEYARSVSPQESRDENSFGAASEEAAEGRALGSASQESVVDSGQGPTSRESSADDASPIANSKAFSERDIASSSATTQCSTQGCGTSDICPGLTATTTYAAMSQPELRSLCRSRCLMQNGLSGPQLRKKFKAYDQELAAQVKPVKVDVDAEHETAELGVAPTASPTLAAFIDLDSSSQDGLEVAPSESHPPAAFIDLDSSSQNGEMGASAASMRKEPGSGYFWTVSKGPQPPVSTDAQEEARQGGLMERLNARMASEKGPYISPYPPRLVLNAPKTTGDESSPWTITKWPMSLQQPLVSLLNLTIRDTEISASESVHQGTQMKAKPLSKYAMKVAGIEEFNARYTTESPSWICCCETPGYEVRQKQLAAFSANCYYHVSQLAQRGSFTMKQYKEYLITQQALSQIASCLCQKPATDHPEHQVTMTQGGFILGQIWREQLIRRQSLTSFRPDMAAYRRKGILEVMHNIHEDFMIELSSRQRKRPLLLWARMEAMAWFISTLPTSNEWHYFEDRRRPCRYIMLFGIALLTTIDALLQNNLFREKEARIANLGLILALFIQSTWKSPSCTMDSADSEDAYNPPFTNDICVRNENGWAGEVVSLADQHGVRIHGAKSIDFIVDQWRLRKKSFESIRDRARGEQYAALHSGETIPPSEATLIAAKEGETPVEREIGPRVTWRPEDDYDGNGTRLWEKWFYLREFEIYTRDNEVTDESRDRARG